MRYVIAVVLLLTACGSPGVGPKITGRAESGGAVVVTTPPSTAPKPTLGPAPADLRAVDWDEVPLPARFCGVEELVRPRDGQAKATSATWGDVTLYRHGGPVHGDLDGDGRDEVAVSQDCDNGGGTAASQLAFGFVVVRSVDGALELVGEIETTTMRDDASHVPLLGELKFEKGAVTVVEHWYRPSDSNCCPSGASLTKWRLRDGGLVPDPAVQIS